MLRLRGDRVLLRFSEMGIEKEVRLIGMEGWRVGGRVRARSVGEFHLGVVGSRVLTLVEKLQDAARERTLVGRELSRGRGKG